MHLSHLTFSTLPLLLPLSLLSPSIILANQIPISSSPFEAKLNQIRTESTITTDHEKQWDYSGVTGPIGWSNLDPSHYINCSTASSQSPINIDESMKPNYFNYKWNAPKSYCYNMTNDGHGIILKPCATQIYGEREKSTGSGGKNLNTNKYDRGEEEWFTLSHISLHSPSEHKFLGEYFPLEAQFVMKNQHNEKYRIRSVLFDIEFPGKKASTFFDGIYPHLPAIAKRGSYTLARDVNTVDLMRTFQKAGLAGQVYNYKGSLTTPPCTPGVEWDVLSDPMYVTVETYLVVKAIVRFNSRYTQNKLGQENLLQVACHAEQHDGY